MGADANKTPAPTLGASPRNITSARFLQFSKAPSPMLVTLSGIVMLVRLLQFVKVHAKMLVTDLRSTVAGMISAPDAFRSQSVIVIASPSVRYVKLGSTDTASFSPHPPRSRGSDTMIRNKGKGFIVGYGL